MAIDAKDITMKATTGGVLSQPDSEPDAFAFTDQSNVATNTVIESNQITVSGMDFFATAAISVDVGEYQINDGAWVSAPGVVNGNDLVRVRHTSSASGATQTNQLVTIGSQNDTFTTTTQSAGTVYYVSAEGDNSDGLTHATAWNTYATAMSQFSSLQAGDSILFANGETFASTSTGLSNANTTAQSPITIGGYAPPTTGSTVLPIISGGSYSFNFNGSITGCIIRDLRLQGASSRGIWLYNSSTNNIDLIDLEITDCNLGIHFQSVSSGANIADCSIVRCNVFDNGGGGFLGGGDRLLVEDSIFSNNGFVGGTPLYHNFYVSNASGATVDSVFRRNKFYQSALAGGLARGTTFVLHGVHTGVTIDNNIIWEDQGASAATVFGLGILTGYTFPENMSNLTITNNTISNVGNLCIGANVCPNSLFANNTILNQQTAYGTTGISVPGAADSSFGPNLADTTNVTVRDNIIINDSSASMTALNIGEGDGATYTVQDNAVYYSTGSSVPVNSFDSGDTITQSNNTITTPEPAGKIAEILALCTL